MIFRHKKSGIVVQDSFVVSDIQGKHYRFGDKLPISLHLCREDSERLYTEEEKDNEVSNAIFKISDELNRAHVTEKQLVINWEQQYEKALLDIGTESHTTFGKIHLLKERIAELEAKLPQPVEISQDLFNAIEYIKVKHKEWENVFLDCKLPVHYLKFDSVDAEALFKTFRYERLEIIKNGYTVKPDPLREGIASLVARYTNEDGVSGETDLIEKLAEYVRSHFGGETE